jgi:formiminoglutamase
LNGEEACAICRYAGISDKVSSFGIYEYNPAADIEEQTAQLIAQMIWYFIEGVNQRKGDIPSDNNPNYLRYRVAVSNHAEDIYSIKVKIR